MGELLRVTTQRSTLASTARAPERTQRARRDRRELDAAPLRRMMVAGALQPRLAVGAADDPFEREAERAADTVMAPEGAPNVGEDGIGRAGVAASLMRVVRRALGKTDPTTRKDDEDEKKRLVQKESAGAEPTVVPAHMESSIDAMTAGGRGSPLPSSLRTQFEPRFGYDFGRVRTHTGGDAATAATALAARAFTVGDHIFFATAEYQPTSTQGQRLIAHELAHVVQQSGTGGSALSQPVAASTAVRRVQRRRIVSWEIAGKRLYKTLSGVIIELPEDMTAQQVAQLEDEAIASEQRLSKLPPPKPVPEVHKPAPKPARTEPPKPRTRKKRFAGMAPPKPAEAAAALMKAVGGGTVAQYLAAKGAPVFARGAEKLSRLKLNEQTHDDGGEKLKKSEDAVVIPASEEQSEGNAGQVSVIGARSAPVVDENKGKRQLVQSLEANVPRTIAAVDNFKRDKKAEHTGAEVTAVVQGDKNAVIGTFGDFRLTPPPVPSTHQAADLPPVEKAPLTPVMNLGRGVIAPLLKEHTDVSAYTKQADDRLKEEGVTQEQLDIVDSGELAEANKEKKGMAQRAATEPIAVQKLAQQQTERVDKELVDEEKAGRTALHSRRKVALDATAQKQKGTKTALEKKREQVATEINGRYKTAQDLVTKKLADLETQSMKRFDVGNAAAAKDFEDNVHRELEAYKDKRYSGWFGWARKAKDWWRGMDELPEVRKIFERNRKDFTDRIDKLVEDIAADNRRVIQECKEELDTARKKIHEYVGRLGPGLKTIGKQAAGEMDDRLNDLDKLIGKKEEELQNKLKDKQTAAIRAIDEKIEKMKEEMSGALAKLGRLLLWAAKKFFSWALEKFGFSLSTIESIIDRGTAVLKAIFTGPIQFVKNLIAAAKLGFSNFAKNFLTHLKDAVFEWLTGALQGVTLPDTWNLKGVLSVLFQVVGLTWANIKSRLVLLIPAPVVETLETTFDLVKTLIVEGPIAAWEQLKDIGEELRKGFVESVTNWIKWKVVEEAVKTVLALFTPGAGIVRAVIAIYDTIVFFIQKAKDIIEMIGNFLGSMSEIAAGRIDAAADALENGLARGLKLVIVFLAKFLRLDGITARIRTALDAVRDKVNAVIDRVAKWVVNMAKKAGKIGGKTEEKKDEKDEKDGAAAPGAAPETTFDDDGESHRISGRVEGDVLVATISSDTKHLDEFLDAAEKSDKFDAKAKAAQLTEARAAIAALKAAFRKLSNKKEKANEAANRKAAQARENEVALALRKLLSGVDIKAFDQRYKLEGLVGTYGSMPTQSGDKLTPDHQPQAALVKYVADLEYVDPATNTRKLLFAGLYVRTIVSGHATGAVAINLHENRHKKGLTFGQSVPKSVLKNIDDEVTAPGSLGKKRKAVIDRVKTRLGEECDRIKNTATKDVKNFPDVVKFADGSDKKAKPLIEKITAQINEGEGRVLAQDLDRWMA